MNGEETVESDDRGYFHSILWICAIIVKNTIIQFILMN